MLVQSIVPPQPSETEPHWFAPRLAQVFGVQQEPFSHVALPGQVQSMKLPQPFETLPQVP